ncbi:MAG TPA: RNA polymerase sigma-70 factor [Puia sp.]|jgi:RNA polymerase sigma-70 factor (ECF subfamily)
MRESAKIDIVEIQLRLAQGDEAAFKTLYDYYSPRLFQFAYAIIHSREMAEEIVADVFLQIWHKRVRIGSLENLNWYLHITTRNISYTYYRKNNRRKSFDFDEAVLSYYHVHATPEEILIGQEVLQVVNQAINDLPSKCKLIFRLVKEDNLKYREVAELLHLTPKTVENQMGIAVKKIHEAIRKRLPRASSLLRRE